jgi:integrase
MKLDNKAIVEAVLPPGSADHIFWDDDVTGLGLRLREGGSRSFVVQYRADGRTRRASLPRGIKIADARAAARKLLAKVALGGDPQGEKIAKRKQIAHTFRSVVDAYLAAKQPELRPVSFRISKLYLTGSYFRPLHSLVVNAITRSDVATCIRAIARNHSAATAAAARRALSAFFAWAIADGMMGDAGNPVDGSHRPADPKPRDRVLTNDELVAIWRACQDDEFGRMVQLLILLGCRRQEIGGFRCSELDLNAGTWRLPEERSKNHRAHTLVLPQAALELLAAVPRQTDRDHLFGVRGTRGFAGWSKGKARLDARLGGSVQSWRVHDLRRTVATRMADIGILPHTIEATLNHQGGHKAGIAGVYNRSVYEREVKAALALWSEHVLALVEGRGSKVVPITRSVG